MDPRQRTIQSDILAGTCEFVPGSIRIGDGKAFSFEIQVTRDRFYSVVGNLYDQHGTLLVVFTERQHEIIHKDVTILAAGVDVFPSSRCRIRLRDKLWAQVIVSREHDRVLELRVLANNKLLVSGDIFGPESNVGVRFAKDHTEVGPISVPFLGGAPGSGVGPLLKCHKKVT
jgi:hypothetical protein